MSVTMDRNPKWRMNDLVFMRTCAKCGVKVEWQHSDPEQNNQNNFNVYLYQQRGWSLKKDGLFGRREWFCELHNK